MNLKFEEKICILVPIYPAYSWLKPFLIECLNYFWPNHPEIKFAELDASHSASHNLKNTNWTSLVQAGVRHIQNEGFTLAYLIAEEHLPIAPCHSVHLNDTLPMLMQKLPAVYISLMGWDNRRYPSKSPVLEKQYYRLKHLVGLQDPRFHLHPALWRVDTLAHCCKLASEDASQNGSAWHFEKANAHINAPLPTDWKQQCYQLCAAEMGTNPVTPLERLRQKLERLFYLKLMALYPLIPLRHIADAYFRAVGFDRFTCMGPYPMAFSGALAKGKLNPMLKSGLCTTAFGRNIYRRLIESYHCS